MPTSKRCCRLLMAVAVCNCSLVANAATLASVELQAPPIVHAGRPFTVVVQPSPVSVDIPPHPAGLTVEQQKVTPFEISGEAVSVSGITIDKTGPAVITVESPSVRPVEQTVRVIPAWLSILPPVIAIGLAFWLRTVIPAIFLGVWAGVLVTRGFSPEQLLPGLLAVFSENILHAMADRDHASILLFTGMIGGMVGIISKNGGMQGVVDQVIKWANSPRRGQLAVWFLGICVFFDDYTNTLVVGNAVRPVTDRLRISREKLAYIVDSTAAPVACVALITTWIGYEVGLIAEASGHLAGFDEPAYAVFLHSIAYSFYPILAILFVLFVAWSGRDFGPMLAAERRSYGSGQVAPTSDGDGQHVHSTLDTAVADHTPRRAINAVLPIVTLVAGCIGGLYFTGEGDTVQELLSNADAYTALMWGSLLSALVAAVLTLGQRIMPLQTMVNAWSNGVTVMIAPLIILILAWALSDITNQLGTADFLVHLAGDHLSPATLPAWAFFMAAVAGFATGSSWGVMAILLPLVVPLVWAMLLNHNMATPDHYHLLYSAVACVLGGSVWGDHCSPISDTTVLSSLASNCDHIEHVRTQMPYAITVGGVALLAGTLPAGYGLPWWAAFAITILLLLAIIRYLGKPSQIRR